MRSKKPKSTLLRVTLAVLVLGGGIVPVAADITIEQDSVAFTYKYEFDGTYMTASPDVLDLDSNGHNDMGLYMSGGDTPTFTDGKMTITTSGGDEIGYCVGDGLSGDPDNEIWRAAGFTADQGFTIELSAKVLSQTAGTSAATSIWAVAGDPSNLIDDDTDGRFQIAANGQAWSYPGGTSYTTLGTGAQNNTDDYHVFRIALDPTDQTFSVWRDKALIGQGLGDVMPGTDGLNRFIIGDLSGVDGGSVSYEYLRLSQGAYAPVDSYVPSPNPITAEKHSSNFTYKYEFNGNYADSAPDSATLDLDGNGAADMTLYQSGGDTPTVAGGSLTITTVGSEEIGYCTADGLSADPASELWRNVGFDIENGFTLEFSAKVLAQQDGKTAATSIYATPADANSSNPNDPDGWLRIAADGQQWGLSGAVGEEGVSYNNTDDFHVFRLALNPIDQTFWLWRDGELLSNELSDMISGDGLNRFIFGDVSGADGGSVEFDYIRLTQGAFIPGEASAQLPGDANGDGTVNASDAAMLAANWQKTGNATWAEGDFSGDGNVDDIDATILAANWQKSTTMSTSVPEPSAMLFIVVGLLTCMLKRKYG